MKHDIQAFGNDHERTDAHAGPLVQFFIILTIVCAAAFYGMRLLIEWFQQQPVPLAGNIEHPLSTGRIQPPEPRVERARDAKGSFIPSRSEWSADLNPYFTSQTLGALHVREREHLSSYAWIDKQQQIARIPIEKAIELTAKKGLPVADKK